MRGIKNHLFRQAKIVRHIIWPYPVQNIFIQKHVPYFCQWESRNLAKSILEKKISTDDDPKWAQSGAKTKKEYNAWSRNGCGMACTKMILAHRTGKVVPLVELGVKCAKYGGYSMPLDDSPGLYYKPYLAYLEKEYGWNARIIQGMTFQELMHELCKGNYVIASVSPHIRYPNDKPKSKTGHLILVVGYDKIKQKFYLHNPSGISKDTQEYAAVKFSDFKKFFSGRCIVVEGDKKKESE